MSAEASRTLALVREQITPDPEGRKAAAGKLVAEILAAAESAKLQVEGRVLRVAAVSVEVTPTEMGVEIDGRPLDGLAYDPLAQVFVGRRAEDAVDVAAAEIARLLESKHHGRALHDPFENGELEEVYGDAF